MEISMNVPEIVFYALFLKYCLEYVKKELTE